MTGAPLSYLDLAVQILGYLGLGGLSLGAVVAISWAAFRHFSKSWLDEKFKKRMADYDHALALKTEQFRSDLATLLDRSTKLHSQEFEVLPHIWELLARAMGATSAVIAALQHHPDVVHMTPAELDVALTFREFKDHEKAEIHSLQGQARQARYTDLYDRYRFGEASEASRELYNYVILKGIFLDPTLRADLREISQIVDGTLTSFRLMKWDSSGMKQFEKWGEITDEWKKVHPMRDAIQEKIYARLWALPAETPDTTVEA